MKRFRLLTLQSLAVGLMDSGVALRYETGLRPADKQWPDWIERQKARIATALDDIEANWKTELSSVNCGSIAVGCLLGYLDFRYGDMGWRDSRPNLASFYETFAKRRHAFVVVVRGGGLGLQFCLEIKMVVHAIGSRSMDGLLDQRKGPSWLAGEFGYQR